MAPFPPAADPRLVVRVLEGVATGVRHPRSLAERLSVEGSRTQSAIDAAIWLGLLEDGDGLCLTADGLACAYAGRERVRVWSRVIRRHPALGPLVPATGPVDLDALFAWVVRTEPGLSAARARRIARAVRRLVRPALKSPAVAPGPVQLTLPLGPASGGGRRQVDLRAGAEESPDVYLRVLVALLDHGELSLPQLRAVLDHEGAGACALGGYVAMAVRRGDARRLGDSLVVTRGATTRAVLADSPVTVALSDPDFRAFLEGGGRPSDSGRFAPWVRRLFRSGDTRNELSRVLFGRPLSSVPLAGDPLDAPPPGASPFAEVASRRGLMLARPSSLRGLRGGVGAVNRALRAAGMEPGGVRLPSALDPRRVVHGGLLAPEEPPPRAVPDGLSLRLRAITHAPALALLAAVGLLERRRVLTWRPYPARLYLPERHPVELSALFQRLARARGWDLVEGPGSLPWEEAVDLAVELAILVVVGGRVTLDELLFRRLQEDLEHRAAWEALQPLAELLLDRLVAPLDG